MKPFSGESGGTASPFRGFPDPGTVQTSLVVQSNVLARDYGERLVNLASVLDQAADEFGDRVAFGDRTDGLTYEQLRRAAMAVSVRLAATAAERVTLVRGNDLLVPTTLFGTAWAGRTYAPLNHRLAPDAIERLRHRLSPSIEAEPSWVDPNSTDRVPYDPDPALPALIIFTSGTSADPKAAVLTHRQLLAFPLRQPLGAAGTDEVLMLSHPPFHVPSVNLIIGAVWAGRRIVFLPGDRFDPRVWLSTVRDEGVTHSVVVPTMLHRIVEALESDRSLQVPTLRRLTYGSARMPLPVLERALQLLPDVDFVNGYGLTETSGAVTVLDPDSHRRALNSRDAGERARLGSVGRPLPGVEIKIARSDGSEAALGQSGEILIRGEQVSGCYADSSGRVDGDGWFRSGDYGWVDDAGYLFCDGRGDDTIIRGGENIAAAEVEDALLQHDGVSGAAVVGLPDEEYGERVAAMVTLRAAGAGVDESALRAWSRQMLGSFKTPELVVIVDDLPQTPTGKILRREVRRLLEEQSSAAQLPTGRSEPDEVEPSRP